MKVGAFKVDTEKGFKLSLHDKYPDAPLSPFYLNLRTDKNPKPGPLTDELVRGIAIEIVQAVQAMRIQFDAIAGIPNAGRPFAQAAEHYLQEIRKPVAHISLTKHAAKDGTRRLTVHTDYSATNGNMARKRVLIVDDLVTSQTMKEMAAQTLMRAGHTVVGVGVYLDRSKGGIRQLHVPAVPLASAVTIQAMLEVYRDQRLISASDFAHVKRYLAQSA